METKMSERRRPILALAAATLIMIPALNAIPAFSAGLHENTVLAKAAECTMYIDPSYEELDSGDLVSLDIVYQGYDPLQEVRGITATVDFDSSIVDLESIVEGGFLASGGPTQFYANDLGNSVTIDCAIIGGSSGAQGSGVYATIVFEGMMSGTTSVHLRDIIVRDPDNQPIQAASGDGTLVVFLPTESEAVPLWAIKRMLFE
jgi:hypothetical protein